MNYFLNEFSKKQLKEVSKILNLYAEGKYSDDFIPENVEIECIDNKVYLTNEQEQYLSLKDNELVIDEEMTNV